MTRKLAERVVARRWYVIAGWVVLAALLVVGAVTRRLPFCGLPPSPLVRSTQAQTVARNEFPSVASASASSRWASAADPVLSAADLQKVDALAMALDAATLSPALSEDLVAPSCARTRKCS